MAPRPCVIDLAIGLLVVMAVFVVQSSGACDRETIRDYMRHCSHVYITKRSIPEQDRSIMGRLRSAHNTNVCQPIKPSEIADYEDGPQPDELSEQLVQKMNEMLEDYRKEEVVQHNGLYRRGARHVGPARRGGFQCDIRVLSELCLNK